MEQKIVYAMVFGMTTVMAAVILGYVEHYDLGLSRHTIRADLLLAAGGLFGLLIIALYSNRFGRPK